MSLWNCWERFTVGRLLLRNRSSPRTIRRYPEYEKVWSFEIGHILWYLVANVCLSGTVDSQMWMWKMSGGYSKVFVIVEGRTESGQVMVGGRWVLCGYNNGGLKLFDLSKVWLSIFLGLILFGGECGSPESIFQLSALCASY